jgi:hypothetical protein
MVVNQDLQKSLNDAQWTLMADIFDLLEPLMVVQRLLEGEKYVTISLVPHCVFKVRKYLNHAQNKPNHFEYYSSMLDKLVESFTDQRSSLVKEHATLNILNRVMGTVTWASVRHT